jgi:hypothetical protein
LPARPALPERERSTDPRRSLSELFIGTWRATLIEGIEGIEGIEQH